MSPDNNGYKNLKPDSKILVVNTLCEDNKFTSALVKLLKNRFANVLVAHERSELIELLTFWMPDFTFVLLNSESKINLQFIKSTKVVTKLAVIYPHNSTLKEFSEDLSPNTRLNHPKMNFARPVMRQRFAAHNHEGD